jgi:uncharacterized protein involved in exopolysaccharide biosynthesis
VDGQPVSRFRILDPAIPPAEPVAPNRVVLTFLALVGCLALAAGAVAAAEWIDTSFHGAEDVRSFTRVPVLASIPLIVAPADVRRRRWRLSLGGISVVIALGVVIGVFHRLARAQDALVSLLARS